MARTFEKNVDHTDMLISWSMNAMCDSGARFVLLGIFSDLLVILGVLASSLPVLMIWLLIKMIGSDIIYPLPIGEWTDYETWSDVE